MTPKPQANTLDMPKFRKPFERLSNVDKAEVMQVVVVESLVGQGDGNGTPKRLIKEYFSLEGELLARRDSYLEGELAHGVWTDEQLKEKL